MDSMSSLDSAVNLEENSLENSMGRNNFDAKLLDL